MSQPQDPNSPPFAGQYNQPGQYGGPAPFGQYPQPLPSGPAPTKASPLIWVGVAVALAAALVIAFVLLNSKNPGADDAKATGGRSLSLPSSVDGYQRLTSIDTTALKQQLGSQLSSLGGDAQSRVQHAQLGVFATGQQPQVIFIGISLQDVPKLRSEVSDNGVEASLKAFVSGVGGSTNAGSSTVYDAGPLGGFMRCADGTEKGNPVTSCAWGDRSAFALTIVVNPASQSAAATLTRNLRALTEK